MLTRLPNEQLTCIAYTATEWNGDIIKIAEEVKCVILEEMWASLRTVR